MEARKEGCCRGEERLEVSPGGGDSHLELRGRAGLLTGVWVQYGQSGQGVT